MDNSALKLSESDYSQMAEHAQAASKLLKAMANEYRLQILCALGGKELSVSELNRYIPLSQSALSQHLAKLRADRLVQTRRSSQTIFYRISAGASQEIISVLQKHYCADLSH